MYVLRMSASVSGEQSNLGQGTGVGCAMVNIVTLIVSRMT